MADSLRYQTDSLFENAATPVAEFDVIEPKYPPIAPLTVHTETSIYRHAKHLHDVLRNLGIYHRLGGLVTAASEGSWHRPRLAAEFHGYENLVSISGLSQDKAELIGQLAYQDFRSAIGTYALVQAGYIDSSEAEKLDFEQFLNFDAKYFGRGSQKRRSAYRQALGWELAVSDIVHLQRDRKHRRYHPGSDFLSMVDELRNQMSLDKKNQQRIVADAQPDIDS